MYFTRCVKQIREWESHAVNSFFDVISNSLRPSGRSAKPPLASSRACVALAELRPGISIYISPFINADTDPPNHRGYAGQVARQAKWSLLYSLSNEAPTPRGEVWKPSLTVEKRNFKLQAILYYLRSLRFIRQMTPILRGAR